MSQFDELPEGWELTQLGQIIELKYGKSLPKDKRDSGRYLVYGSNGVVGSHSEFIVSNPSLIVGRKGSIGEINISEYPCWPIDTTYFIDNLFEQPIKFWFYQIKHLHLQELDRASAIPGLNREDAYKQEIPLPPLNEQRRIVEKIEALTARSRKAQEALEAIPELLDQFRQSVLAAAFRGDLTADWREQNPDVEPAEAFKNFYKNEIGWTVGKANDACIGVQSGSTPKGKPFTESGEVPFLKVYNIVNQQIDFNYRPQYVSHEVHKNSLKRSITLPGDVLMNIVGPPLGKIALVTEQFPEWNINQAIVNFRPKKGLLSKYLYYYLREGSLVREVINETKGIVGQVNISLTQCRESIVEIPSLEEQVEIIRRIEGLFSLADSLSDAFKSGCKDLEELDQSILAKAFRGQLVPQDPNDEPAAVLLERIRAERETIAKKKGQKKRGRS